MFILYFVLASVITTVVTAVLSGPALAGANELFSLLKTLSKFFIVMAWRPSASTPTWSSW